MEYVTAIKKGEVLLLNISFNVVGGVVLQIEGNNNDEIIFLLKKPMCSELSEKIAISRKIGNSWRIIGWGEVISNGEEYIVSLDDDFELDKALSMYYERYGDASL